MTKNKINYTMYIILSIEFIAFVCEQYLLITDDFTYVEDTKIRLASQCNNLPKVCPIWMVMFFATKPTQSITIHKIEFGISNKTKFQRNEV